MSNEIFLDVRASLCEQIALAKSKVGEIPPLFIIYDNDNENGRSFAMSVDRLCRQYDIPTIIYRTTESSGLDYDISELISDRKHCALIINPIKTHINIPIHQDLDISCRNNKMLGNNYVDWTGQSIPLLPAVVEAVTMLIKNFFNSPMEIPKPHNVYINNKSLNVGLPLSSSLFMEGYGVCHTVENDWTDYIGVIVSATGKDRTADIIDAPEGLTDKLIVDVGSRIINGKLVGDINYEDIIKVCGEGNWYISPKEVGTLTSMIIIKRFLERIHENNIYG